MHETRIIHDWLIKRPRCHTNFTSTEALWLNMVEGWFTCAAAASSSATPFADTEELEVAISVYVACTYAEPKLSGWTKIADPIPASVARFYQCPSDKGT